MEDATTKAQRAAIKKALERSRVWDASTMLIGRKSGEVTAKKDLDSNPSDRGWFRYLVADASAIATADGIIREGW